MSGEPGPLRITASSQLRLSVLLDRLRTDAHARHEQHAASALERATATISPGDPVVIDASDGLTIAEILDATASAGFGFVIALLALTAIPFFGLSTPFGLAIAFVGAQLVVARPRPWLPKRIRRVELSEAALDRIARWFDRATRWMSRGVRPRLRPLTRGIGSIAIGIGLVVQGLGLALPLPIPGSNMIFIVPILIYGMGLLENDGVLIVIGHVTTAADLVLGFVAWRGVVAALEPIARWIGWW